MAGIKKTITNNNNDEIGKKNSIKKTEYLSKSQDANEKSLDNNNTSQKVFSKTSYKEAAKQLLDIFGHEVINSLKNNQFLKIPYTYSDITDEEWLLKAIQTILNENDVILILQSINNKYNNLINKVEILQTEIEKINKNVKNKQSENQKLEKESDKYFIENKKLKEEISKSVNLSLVFESVFSQDNQKGLLRLAKEAVDEDSDEETVKFLLAFLNGWTQIIPTLEIEINNEEEKVELYDQVLRELLLLIKDLQIPQRRAFLDALARYINKNLNEFEFISPEETIQIDIDLHNAKGIGGSKIKQGLSYAVVRKENRQTYKYADIEVY